MENKENRLFYEQFPRPPEINPFHLHHGEGFPTWQEVKDEWWNLFSARDEWSDKVVKEQISDEDAARWRAVYDKFRDIIKRGVEDKYQDNYLGG